MKEIPSLPLAAPLQQPPLATPVPPPAVTAPAQSSGSAPTPAAPPAAATPPTTPAPASFDPTAAAITNPQAAIAARSVSAWTPTYRIGNQTVAARTHFRMLGGVNQLSQGSAIGMIERGLTPEQRQKAGITTQDILRVAMGRGTPEQTRKITQALIDAGHLQDPEIKAPPTADLETMVRRLQWRYGVGTDCQGSLRSVIAAVTGREIPNPGDNLILTGKNGALLAASSPYFSVAVASDGQGVTGVRAGDVIKLDATEAGEPGHYVMVTDTHTIQANDPEAQRLGDPSIRGPLQVMTVFSSWGANGDPNNQEGGVRSETWVCDTGRNPPKWGSVGADGRVDWNAEVHRTHTLVGVYRPTRPAAAPPPRRP